MSPLMAFSAPPWRPSALASRRRAARLGLASLALLSMAGEAAGAADGGLNLRRPSPDWRDQVIYFAVTDRFDDGDPGNNDQGASEYRPGSDAHYQGGDLAGLTRRLDYIRGLGATALWLTPPVANQWWDPLAQYGGYHGYWAEHFAEVDRHLGSLDDYRRLSHALHSVGMVLVQDIVVNHTGNFFGYPGGWSARDPAAHWQANTGALPAARPSQPPFDLNDPRDPAQRRAAIYHWTPAIRDHGRRHEELNFQLSGLDDLNTENPEVRRALRASYGHWIREVGVDAFRIDTAFYVPPAFFDDFLHARDPQAPGIAEVARQTGRRDFLSFGEGFAIDRPGQDRGARKLERYATGPNGRPRLTGMLNFPLYGSLGDVFARGHPPAELAWRIGSMMKLHRDPHRMPSFVDNHDVDRFLAAGSEAALRQALLAIMTLPGIPVIYYGTEQGFRVQRGSMFAAGAGSGGRDHFDTEAPLYRLLQRLTALRRSQPVLSRGLPRLLQSSAAGPGVLVWRMAPAAHQRGNAVLVALNTAERPMLMAGVATGAPPGSRLAGLLALDGDADDAVVDAGGRLTRVLPPRSGAVWLLPDDGPMPVAAATAATAAPRAVRRGTATPATPPAPTLDPPRLAADGSHLLASGRAAPGTALQLLADGDTEAGVTVRADADGRWSARLATDSMVDARLQHRLQAWVPDTGAVSAPQPLRVARRWTLLADHLDPAGDDRGPAGRTLYPTDAGWGANRQMDLRRVRLWGAGGALKVEVDTHRVTQSWNPPNGFDHVAFTLFIGLPGRDDGSTVMPLQDGELPDGMRWQLRLRAHGWSNALFGAEGASASHEGRPLTPGAVIEVDRARHRVSFTLPASALGRLPSLSGLKLYLSTWDWDGGYRAITDTPGGHTPGGPPGPRVMDDLPVITLP